MHSNVCQWGRVVVTGYNSVFLVYNWSLYWVTTLLGQNFLNSTMIFRALVQELECFNQGLLLPCLYTNLSNVLSHLPPQCKTLVFAFQFRSFSVRRSFQILVRRSFQLGRSSMHWRLSRQNSSGQLLQNSVLIRFSFTSRNAIMREVLMFPADCSKRTGMSLISTFNKLSTLNLCASKGR